MQKRHLPLLKRTGILSERTVCECQALVIACVSFVDIELLVAVSFVSSYRSLSIYRGNCLHYSVQLASRRMGANGFVTG